MCDEDYQFLEPATPDLFDSPFIDGVNNGLPSEEYEDDDWKIPVELREGQQEIDVPDELLCFEQELANFFADFQSEDDEGL